MYNYGLMETRIYVATYMIMIIHCSSITGLKVAGIYRFCGNAAKQIQKLQYRIDQGTYVQLCMHDVAKCVYVCNVCTGV